jgi:phage portal protein BeeE
MANTTAITNAKQAAIRRVLPGAKVRAITNASNAGAFMDMLGVFQSNPPARGTTETLKSYSTMPWLRAVVDKISSSIATTVWRVFVKVKVNDDGTRNPIPYRQLSQMTFENRKAEILRLRAIGELIEIEDHPIIDALYAAGPSFTGYTSRELTQKWIDLVGEAFWIKERGTGGVPTNFIPITPGWVTNTPNKAKKFFEIQPPGGAKPQEIRPEDMIWFYHPNPADPYGRGSGMGVTLADELETDEYAAKFMKQFFYNSARPDFLISSNELKKEDTDRLEKRWYDKLRGFRRSFLPFFMNRKVEVHTLGTDYSHLEMLGLRKHQRDAVIQIFGVPPEVLGIVEASNRATSEVAEYLYARWVLIPRLEFMRQTLQHGLVPDYDDKLILDYDSPVAQDKERILKVASLSPWSIMLDEWREMQGKLPLPDGKGQIFMKPLNYEAVTLDELGNPPSQQGNGDDPPADQDPDAVEPEPDDEPDDDDAIEETISRHGYVWPELLVNTISRQRVTPKIGTRLDQIKAVLSYALSEIQDEARKRADEIETILAEGFPPDAITFIFDKAVVDHAMGPVIAKLTYVYVLAAEQAKANLSWFVTTEDDEVEIGLLEPLFELMGAKATVEWSIMAAINNTLVKLIDLRTGDSAENMTYILIDGIGILEDDVEEFLENGGEGDAVVALVDRFVEDVADHAITHMCNRAQEALWSEAARNGIIDPKAVSRIWISRRGCRSCSECSGLDGVPVAVTGSWDLPKGATVVTPTESHPECHCTEQLVRKEVQDEAAE